MNPVSTIDFNDPRFMPFFREQEYAFLMDTEERTNFFTNKLREKYPHLDISTLNERAYDEIGSKYDIYEGFNIKDGKHLMSTEIDDVYVHIANLKDDREDDTRVVLFLKTNLYTGDMSFIITKAELDTDELEPGDLVDTRELIRDYDGPEDGLYEYIRDRAIWALKDSTDHIWLEGLEVAKINTKCLFEGIIDDKSKDALIKNLYKNTPDKTLAAIKLPRAETYKEYLKALRESAIEDLQFGYLHRLFERQNVDYSYITSDLRQIMEREEAKIMSKNNLILSRNADGKYVVTGTFIGTAGELSKEFKRLNEIVHESEKEPHRQVIAQFNKDMTDAVVMLVKGDIGTPDVYEVGIELPMDFSELRGVDEGKICNLMNINGVPVFVDAYSSSACGVLAGKPALYVMATNKSTEQDVINWAKECIEKVADFDFADYCITHNGYDELLRDDSSRHPDAFDIHQNEEIDDGIEDDLPIEV